MNGPERRRGRILIALSATAETRIELGVYRYLLGDAPPEIVGLVVEDPGLLAHAGSGLAREIVLSGLERRLDPNALERQLRARAAEWRRTLELESVRLGVNVGFETVRDERRAALARAAERTDALIVDRAALGEALDVWNALPPSAPLRALILAPPRPAAGDIVAVTDQAEPGDAAGSALAVAVRVARRTGAPLAVLDVGSSAADSAALARRLARLGVRLAGYVSLGPRADARTLAAYTAHAGLVVLPAAASRDAALVAGLAARIRGALMLLRSAEQDDA